MSFLDLANAYFFAYITAVTVLGLAMGILSIVAIWRIFVKAGEPGWAAIVPFYNLYTFFKITWGSGWKFLLLLIPIVNFVIIVITMVKLARAFGKGGGFAVGLIFLNIIFYCILAFDNSRYIGVQ
ncbi:MAG: hypothetical protein GX625_05080 [Clostridiaceae bacterium]|nr:hypothetical protein [Clostridiaceae bacterium]